MTWLTLLRMLLSLAIRLSSLVREKRLMEAGAAHALREQLIAQRSSVASALEAREKVREILERDPGALFDDDGYRRD